MKLITYDFDGAPAVMHYLGSDKPEAIAAEICKAHGLDSPPKWREITKAEYAAIRAARPKPAVKAQDHAPPAVQPTTAPQIISTPHDDTAGKLALAVAMAGYAIQAGVQAGDYRWHGGDTDFEWQGVRYDAPGLIEHARSVLG